MVRAGDHLPPDLHRAVVIAGRNEKSEESESFDRRDDGTNVACVPSGAGFRFSYGPGSFARHCDEAVRLGFDHAWYVNRCSHGMLTFLRTFPQGSRRKAIPERPARRRPPEERPTPTVDLAVPHVALAVGAHPDDIEFGCGATLAKWAAAGCRVHHLVLTDGSKGTWDSSVDSAELTKVRKHEQQDAAAILGGGDVTFLDLVDGELDSGEDTRTARLRGDTPGAARRGSRPRSMAAVQVASRSPACGLARHRRAGGRP